MGSRFLIVALVSVSGCREAAAPSPRPIVLTGTNVADDLDVVAKRLRKADLAELEVRLRDGRIEIQRPASDEDIATVEELATNRGGFALWFAVEIPDGLWARFRESGTRNHDRQRFFRLREGVTCPLARDGWILCDRSGPRITEEDLHTAAGVRDAGRSAYRIMLRFRKDAVDRVAKLTRGADGHLAMIVGYRVLSVPRLRAQLGHSAEITGRFSRREVRLIATLLMSPRLTGKLSVVRSASAPVKK